MNDQQAALIRHAAIELINRGERVTLVTLSAATNLRPDTVMDHYPTVEAIYADLALGLVHTHRQAFTEADLIRRRSANTVFVRHLTTVLHTAAAAPDRHRAVQILRLTHPWTPVSGPDGCLTTLWDLPVLWTRRWLDRISDIQAVTWDLPLPLVARLVVATLSGLATDHPHLDDPADTSRVLASFAYQLSRHAVRNSTQTTLP